jgi:iron(III) transport system substrate-binding protein
MSMLRMIAALAMLAAPGARAADAGLIAAAKKGGAVTWYTTQIINQFARPAAEVFEKTYGVKVNYVRSNPEEMVLRVMNEAKAGRLQVDVIDGTSSIPALKREGLTAKFIPENARRLPAQFIDAEGEWVAGNFYVHQPIFNTDLVKKGTEPRSYEDLLDPKWKGKMSWSSLTSSSSAPGFVGIALMHMGEQKGMEYLRKLATQNITPVNSAARQVVDQVMAGEYPLTLQAFHHHAVISGAKGAPVQWIPFEPAMAVLSVIAVTKDAPHPNAARLFTEFLVSPEGQQLYRDSDYIPVDPAIPARDPKLKPETGGFQAIYLTPEQLLDGLPKWGAVFKQLFK